MQSELLYQISLSLVNGIGPVQSRLLIEHFESAEAIFKAKKKELSCIDGIGEIRANFIKSFHNFNEAELEINFIEKQNIQALFITDKDYPKKLLNCYDPPVLLYYKGNADLNTEKSISIIGTRNNTDYGKKVTEEFVHNLQSHNITVYSGLAFGIDSIAHKACLKNNINTIAVLAHGLETIYPSLHKQLSNDIINAGGLLTEFKRDIQPDKHNFPKRNRIVAGISDATIVIETDNKGGSMITAGLAFNYNKDLFALPGKVTDARSSGCLTLIQQNKASVFINTEHFLENMGWLQTKKTPKKQRELFIDLTKDEKTIVEILQSKDSVSIDEIYAKANMSSSSVAAAILNLELQNVVSSLPGKMYQLA